MPPSSDTAAGSRKEEHLTLKTREDLRETHRIRRVHLHKLKGRILLPYYPAGEQQYFSCAAQKMTSPFFLLYTCAVQKKLHPSGCSSVIKVSQHNC